MLPRRLIGPRDGIDQICVVTGEWIREQMAQVAGS